MSLLACEVWDPRRPPAIRDTLKETQEHVHKLSLEAEEAKALEVRPRCGNYTREAFTRVDIIAADCAFL
jgi:hypothetical protein